MDNSSTFFVFLGSEPTKAVRHSLLGSFHTVVLWAGVSGFPVQAGTLSSKAAAPTVLRNLYGLSLEAVGGREVVASPRQLLASDLVLDPIPSLTKVRPRP